MTIQELTNPCIIIDGAGQPDITRILWGYCFKHTGDAKKASMMANEYLFQLTGDEQAKNWF